jgi:serine/threonine protein kinase/Tol biopolymer transport system component
MPPTVKTPVLIWKTSAGRKTDCVSFMTDDLIGKTIGGYEILGKIGHGGMATVYEARQTSMNRVVALKVLPRHLMQDDTYLQRFEREVKIVAQLEHRNIVPVHDYGEHDQQPYIAMRYMTTGSVTDKLAQGPLDENTVLKIIEQVAPALDYAHSKNVLHRDLKPSNILLDDDGGAYITDFGIARILGTEGKGATITTQGVVGTPSYMSPEQAQGHAMDGRSDVYALGIMLYEMLTGRRPFISDTPYGIAVMQVTTPPPVPRTVNPNISAAVEQVALKALKKMPENRYQTAVELAEALRIAIERPTSLPDTQPRPPKGSLEVTQPAPTRPETSPKAPTPPSSMRPVYQHPAVSAPGSRSFSSSSGGYPPVRGQEKPRRNLWMSIMIGGMIGCGLLSVAGVVMVMVLSNLLSETISTPIPDPTRTPTESITDDPTTTPVFVDATPVERPTEDSSTNNGGDLLPTPTFPPDFDAEAGMIVYFAMTEENHFAIFQLDLKSGEYIQLTNNDNNSTYPLISPDGGKLVFQSDKDGDEDIYLMILATGEINQLTQNTVTDHLPSWSPDGEWVIYSSDTREDGNLDILRVPVSGGEAETLYSDGQRNSHARASADGQRIVFSNGESGDASTWEIMIYDLFTGETTQLTDNDSRDALPSFSHDDQDILYATDGDGESAIAIMPAAGGSFSHVLYDGPGFERGMHTSLDGAFIIFISQVGKSSVLYLMRSDGSDARLIDTEHDAYYPSWMP